MRRKFNSSNSGDLAKLLAAILVTVAWMGHGLDKARYKNRVVGVTGSNAFG